MEQKYKIISVFAIIFGVSTIGLGASTWQNSNRVELYQDLLDGKQSENDDLEEQIASLDNTISNLENDVSNLENEIFDLENDLEDISFNTDLSGSFYQLAMINTNNGGLFADEIFQYNITYQDYFTVRNDWPHNLDRYYSLEEMTTSLETFCQPSGLYEIATRLRNSANDPEDPECVINTILSFVQDWGEEEMCIHYQNDGSDIDFAKYPLETLAEQNGDCEDKSILFASLLTTIDFDVRLCGFYGHVMASVVLPDSPDHSPGWGFDVGEDRFYMCETTGYGWLIGEFSENYQGEEMYSVSVDF